MSDNDNALPKESGEGKGGPLKLFRRPENFGTFLCARLYGFSVRDCKCFADCLECPPEAQGVLEPIAEFRARVHAADPSLFDPEPERIPVKEVLPTVYNVGADSGYARAALATVKQATAGPGIARIDPTDVEQPPETPEQIRAAVAAEKRLIAPARPLDRVANLGTEYHPPAHRPTAAPASAPTGGRAMGFTGNICSNCQGSRMVRNGVCETCLDCYTSGECA